jgi:uncharacterized repeat protein (TIGR03803 family)
VFKLTPAASGYTESIIYKFQGGNDGANPYAGLISRNGALYGTTAGGGGPVCASTGGCGTVFRLTPAGSGYAESTLYRFQGSADGANPVAGLVADNAGGLYDTTLSGPARGGHGTVFKLTPAGSGYAETVLHSFQGGNDGEYPYAGLLVQRGALYGTTSYGGGSRCGAGCGTVFKLKPTLSGFAESVVYSFQAGSDGVDPWAGLIADEAGELYGTTLQGGSSSFVGTVFKLAPAGNRYYVESAPYASALSFGGRGNANAFNLRPVASKYAESIMYRFRGGSGGASPYAALLARNGTLYGTTAFGGGATACSASPPGCGTVFSLKE